MGKTIDRDRSSRPLELVGVSALEERAYRDLLASRKGTASEIAGRLGVSTRAARRLLADLEGHGLVTHTPKVPRVYVAVPPEFAISALVKRRQALLERVRTAIPDLEEQSVRSNHGNGYEPALELITNVGHMGVVLTQMYKAYRSEVLCFQRAPVLVPTVSPPRKLRAGVRVRTISDNSLLEVPGMLDRIRDDVARGEQARMMPALPFKLMIFDRRAAIISLENERPDHALALLVHGHALIHALYLLFEFAWDRAMPVVFARSGRGKGHSKGRQGADAVDGLIPLLAAGLNDKAIAMELGISSATLNRRMSELMRVTGARTRFQLGWQAAHLAAQ